MGHGVRWRVLVLASMYRSRGALREIESSIDSANAGCSGKAHQSFLLARAEYAGWEIMSSGEEVTKKRKLGWPNR